MPLNTIGLKQRLSALSTSHSSPTAPHGLEPFLRSPIRKKQKTFFNAPWVKRQQQETVPDGEYEELEMVQEIMSRMIFQAGVDFETRPMVILNAPALPDPREIPYDLLLSRVLSYLDLYVESDYTVVFFAAGGKHNPGWNWVWKAYRSLNRKYRKNLKRLYIVHSSFFSKMLFSLAGAIISPKFFRKLAYIATLSELAHHVPLTQIDIPPAVYQENLKYEKIITLPVMGPSNIFGIPLEELMGYNGEKGGIPRVVKDSIQFLRESGMAEEGLFRRSPQSTMLRAAQDAYDRGHVVSLETFGDPHLAAVLLKKYLRDLPEPIFSEKLYPVIRRCPLPTNQPGDMAGIAYIRETLLPEILPCSYILLSHILQLLHEVSLRSASNRMDAYNLAIVICPNLVKSSNVARDIMMCGVPGGPAILESTVPSRSTSLVESRTTLGMIVTICIQRYYEVFDEVWDRSEAIPSRSFQDNRVTTSETSSASASPQPRHISYHDDDDDDEIDDAMLVMPIGPSHHGNGSAQNGKAGGPPSAWGTSGGVGFTHTSRRPADLSGGSSSGVRSMHTVTGDNGDGFVGERRAAYSSISKSKSMISIEKGSATIGGRKGSISVGRGTTRKSSGAGVEAIGITAEGFFSAPSSAPPVPTVKRARGTSIGGCECDT